MTKYFCDGCLQEITESNAVSGGQNGQRLGTTVKKGDIALKVEILTGTGGVSNAGLFCKYCILDALYKLDDRKKT